MDRNARQKLYQHLGAIVGTWAVGIWDNDDAADWMSELSESRGLDLLQRSFKPNEVKGYYLEAPKGARVLCAADTLLAALKRGGSSVPEDVSKWVDANARLDFQSLVPEALRRVRRVMAEHSELRELWEENEALFSTWLARVEALAASLEN
jgi:hypothetical protein